MRKKILKWILIASLIFIVLYIAVVLRGNNRLTVSHYHGIWLPSSTRNIKFVLYPAIPRITDDWAKNYCTMSKKDYFDLLRKQKYMHHFNREPYSERIDSLIIDIGVNEGGTWYSRIPDSLMIKFPFSYKCKSSTGDFLVIGGELLDSNTVKVMLYTDWN